MAGIPAAVVELATSDDNRGCISKSIVEAGEELVHGNELLGARDPLYPRAGQFGPWYTVAAAAEALQEVEATVANQSDGGGLRSFARYLLLDAWVSNTDRHHQNWAVLRNKSGGVRMSPSFDHGSSLGFNLSDDERVQRLQTKNRERTVAAFAQRGRSPFFDQKRQSLEEVARRAFQLAGASIESALEPLIGLGDQAGEVVSRIPRAVTSDVAGEFAIKLLAANVERLMQ